MSSLYLVPAVATLVSATGVLVVMWCFLMASVLERAQFLLTYVFNPLSNPAYGDKDVLMNSAGRLVIQLLSAIALLTLMLSLGNAAVLVWNIA